MGPRACLEGRKISSPPGFDNIPTYSSLKADGIPTRHDIALILYNQLVLLYVQTSPPIVTAPNQLNPFYDAPRPSVILANLLVAVLVTVSSVFYLRVTKMFITI